MIPEHCIEIFKKKFSFYPTFISVNPEYIKVDLDTFFTNSTVIWTNERINADGKRNIIEKFIEYDSTGIMIYIKEGKGIFILTRGDRKSVADYMITKLKK